MTLSFERPDLLEMRNNEMKEKKQLNCIRVILSGKQIPTAFKPNE